MNATIRPTALFRPLAGLTLAVGMLGAPLLVTTAIAQQMSTDAQTLAVNRAESPAASVEDGVYLFGENPAPDQVGSTYLVLEVQENAVVGGLYMPHSSFDCFQGEVEGDRLNLSITNSYDLSTYAYSMNLSADGTVASANPTAAPVELEGYHLISSVSDNDLRILDTCKADFQG